VLNWISETLFRVFSWVPNWLYADDTPRYLIVRSLFGVLLLVIVILIVAVWRARRHRRGTDEAQGPR
jgi:Gpi18-like mannosyltransferase